MLLNPLSQNFVIWLSSNFFYPEVVKVWQPVFKRLYLPYVTLEDMFNAQISSISFPQISLSNVTQQLQNYQLTKRGGKQLDQSMPKSLTLTVKLTEGHMAYFMMRQQIDLYLKYGSAYKDLYMPPVNVTILDDGGVENISYTYYQLTPSSLSDYELSYAAKPGSFNTFTVGFTFNYFDIWYRDQNGNRVIINSEDGMLKTDNSFDGQKASISSYKKLNDLPEFTISKI